MITIDSGCTARERKVRFLCAATSILCNFFYAECTRDPFFVPPPPPPPPPTLPPPLTLQPAAAAADVT